MPRANRHYLAGQVWHITHRCHRKEFLLRFRQDRRRWQYWAAMARARYGLSVLNYMVTSNHVHLLVRDRGRGEIAKSMQLISSRTAQEFNQRRGRLGAFWQDRYHATAVSTDFHLEACMRYIDLNMVRAGVVAHPAEWPESGYQDIQQPRARYQIVDIPALIALFDCVDLAALQHKTTANVEDALRRGAVSREPLWSESLAVGNQAFVESILANLDEKAGTRDVELHGATYVLRDGNQPEHVKKRPVFCV